MSFWILFAIIGALSLIFLFALLFSIFLFGHKTKYWDRKLGAKRTWDLGDMGKAVVTFEVDPDDSDNIQTCFQLFQHNGCTQTVAITMPNDEMHQRYMYGDFIDLTEEEVRQELGVVVERSKTAFADLGIHPRPVMVVNND